LKKDIDQNGYERGENASSKAVKKAREKEGSGGDRFDCSSQKDSLKLPAALGRCCFVASVAVDDASDLGLGGLGTAA
jgi:hypothetical protein